MSRPLLPSRAASGGPPTASVGRMILAPIVLCFRRLNIPLPTNIPTSPSHLLTPLSASLSAAIQRFDRSVNPRDTLARLASVKWTISNVFPISILAILALFNLWIMVAPILFKLFLITVYSAALLVPLTSQFVWPATPVFAWLLMFFSARFIPADSRPRVHVALLPALESVLYGANISDLQTRFTHPILDLLAWLPYGVVHYSVPFVVAFTLWAVGPRGGIQYWGKAFGWMNVLGVATQLLFPCAAPWYEIIHGLTPASYSMAGSPGGLMRIDKVFGSTTYTNAFSSQPLVFGAFPSLHSGCAVMEALFLAHFFPSGKVFYWAYVGLLWWSTMYLSHHYLIDLVGGACLSVAVFYYTMPEQFKDSDQIVWKAGEGEEGYAMVPSAGHDEGELDLDEEIRKLEESEGPASAKERSREQQVNGGMDIDRIAGPQPGTSESGPSGVNGGNGKKVTFGQTEVMA